MYRCDYCGSSEVMFKAWVNYNDDKMYACGTDDTLENPSWEDMENTFCNNCEHTTVSSRRERREKDDNIN